ncbi:hypothetical protein ACO0RG_004168 [Hanseniaspora osmophila]
MPSGYASLAAVAGTAIELTLDPQLKYNVLLPITLVIVLTGILKNYIMLLLGPKIPTQPRVNITEQQYLQKGQTLLINGKYLSYEGFKMRQQYMAEALGECKYSAANAVEKSADSAEEEQGPVNPLTDPNASDAMFAMAKGNLMNFIPQTLIMWWVNHYFAGFVLMKLPFPLTVKFKEMLQAGVMTSDLDASWASSISWYFISMFGLDPLFNVLVPSAGMDVMQMQQQQQQQQNPMANMNPNAVSDAMKSLSNDVFIGTYEQEEYANLENRILKMYS